MDFDFNLILVPATLIFFIIWLLDKLFLKRRHGYLVASASAKSAEEIVKKHLSELELLKQKYNITDQSEDEPEELLIAKDELKKAQSYAAIVGSEMVLKKEPTWISWAYDFFPVLALVLIVRSFLFEPFNIPSESMNPTLLTGDFILVNKFDYGVRLPIINKKILDRGEPKRGEVAVFRYPLNPSVNYIKRVIGLPGDKIVFDEGILTINGQVISKVAQSDMGDSTYERFATEKMGTHSHTARELVDAWSASQAPFVNSLNNGEFANSNGHHWEVTVPAKHYFMMGDNRDQSADSRFWGFMPEENLAGRAIYVWMHKEPGFHMPSFNRAGVIN